MNNTLSSNQIIQFIKNHGFEARMLENGKIQMESPFYKQADQSTGIDLIEFVPTFRNAKDALGY